MLANVRDCSRVSWRRPFINLNRHTPSDQSRVYRVTQLLRTDGIHYRESSTGTGPVNLEVVPNGCCCGRGHHGPFFCGQPLFSHIYSWYMQRTMCKTERIEAGDSNTAHSPLCQEAKHIPSFFIYFRRIFLSK